MTQASIIYDASERVPSWTKVNQKGRKWTILDQSVQIAPAGCRIFANVIGKSPIHNKSYSSFKILVLCQLIGGIKIRLKISIFYGEKVVHLADF